MTDQELAAALADEIEYNILCIDRPIYRHIRDLNSVEHNVVVTTTLIDRKRRQICWREEGREHGIDGAT